MADQNAIRAGRAYVELWADDSKLRRDLVGASKKFEAWGASITAMGTALAAAGALIVTPLAAAAAGFALMGAELARASERTGIEVSHLSALAYAADQSGISLEGLEGIIRKMEKGMFDTANVSDKTRRALSLLGVSLADLHAQAPADQINTLADAFERMKDPVMKAGIATELFGRGMGTAFLNLSKNGSAGIRALMGEAAGLGVIMGKDQAEAAVKLEQAFKRLWAVVKYVAVAIGSALAPALMESSDRMARFASGARDWIKDNQGLIVMVFKLGKAIVLVGGGLWVAGHALKYFGSGLGIATKLTVGLLSVLSRGPGLFTRLAQSIAGLFAGITSTFVGILSWTSLVVVAIAGIGYVFLAMSTQGADALAAFGAAWTNSVGIVKTAWGGIVDALNTGDLSLAMKIAWVGAKSVFVEVLTAMKTVFVEFRFWMEAVWDKIAEQAAASWNKVKTIGSLGFAGQSDAEVAKQVYEREEALRREAQGEVARVRQTSAAEDLARELAELNAKAKAGREAKEAKSLTAAAAFTSGGSPTGAAIMPGPSAGTFNPFEAARMGGADDIPRQQLEEIQLGNRLAAEAVAELKKVVRAQAGAGALA